MNDFSHDRLRHQLSAAADEIRLTPGSASEVIATADRRGQRRRQLAAVAAVGLLVGGVGVTLDRLASSDGDMVEMTPPDVSTSDDGLTYPPTEDESSTRVTADTVPDEVAAAGTEDLWRVGITDAVPAELVPSNVVWRVVEPDSAAAVGYASGRDWFGGPQTVPGVFLSTAPGRSNDYEPRLWSTDDGVTWTMLDLDVPFGRLESATFDGSTVYQIGTAPGIRADQPNPLLVGRSTDLTTWQQLELPIDANGPTESPFFRRSVQGSLAADEAGMIAVVRTSVHPDFGELTAAVRGAGYDGFIDVAADGVVVSERAACGDEQPTAGTVPLVDALGKVTLPMTVPEGDDLAARYGCADAELIGWAELGVDPASVAGFLGEGVERSDMRVFRLDGDGSGADDGIEVREVDLTTAGVDGPLWLAEMYSGSTAPRFVDESGRFYELDGMSLVATGDSMPSTDGQSYWSDERGRNSTASFWVGELAPDGDQPSSGWRSAVGARRHGGEIVWADWSTLAPDGMLQWLHPQVVTEQGVVGVGTRQLDPYAAGEVLEIDGFTLRRTSRDGPLEITDPDGNPVPLDRVGIDNLRPELVVGDGDGAELVRLPFDDEVAGMVYGEIAGADGSRPEWLIATSVDAVHVAVESLSDLLGVDDADVRSVPRVSTDGTSIVVAVSLEETNPDGTWRQLVLVGTPGS